MKKVALVVLLVAVLALAAPAAASISVMTCNASDLVAALNAANSSSDDDVIELNGGCTYTLTSVDNVADGNNGLPSILSAATGGSLTINGNGATIERSYALGTPDFRVIRVESGGDLTLNHLVVSNGRAPGVGTGFGGGVFNNGGTVNIVNFSTITNNTADGGGGITNQFNSTLNISNSTFSNNTTISTGSGGAIWNLDMLTVTDSTFSNNNAGGSGGGIVNIFGTVTISNSSFIDNTASSGGGIDNNSGTMTINNSTFSDNTVFGFGGGIFNSGGLTVSNSIFSNNAASGFSSSRGGGIDNNGMLNISNSTFSDNSAVEGGGIFIGGGRTLNISNSTFFNNLASKWGGGIQNRGTLNISNSTLFNNTANGSNGFFGGGLFNFGTGPLTVKNSIVALNPGGDCDIFGTFNPEGVNFDGDGSCTGFITDTTVGTLLSPLQDNGGPTPTLAFQAGNPAIDAAVDCTIVSTSSDPDNPGGSTVDADQRGVARPQGPACDIGAFELEMIQVVQATIDIKPGSDTNPINPKSKGAIPVAILTTDDFDATTVDPLSVEFGPGGAAESHGRGHIEDVDGDGDLDLVLHFRTQDSGILCGDTIAMLSGETFGSQAIEGSDSIETVGCK